MQEKNKKAGEIISKLTFEGDWQSLIEQKFIEAKDSKTGNRILWLACKS
jgi:hypothetical protein